MALNPADGSEKWRIDTNHSAPPAIGNDGTVYTSIANNLYAIDALGNELWSEASAGWPSPSLADDGSLYKGSFTDGSLFPLQVGSGLMVGHWPTPGMKVMINRSRWVQGKPV